MGAALGALAVLFVLGYFLWRRRRNPARDGNTERSPSVGGGTADVYPSSSDAKYAGGRDSVQSPPPAFPPSELPAENHPSELHGSTPFSKA